LIISWRFKNFEESSRISNKKVSNEEIIEKFEEFREKVLSDDKFIRSFGRFNMLLYMKSCRDESIDPEISVKIL
jgi:hypothetical protein